MTRYRTEKGSVFDYVLSMDGHDTYPHVLKAQEAFYRQIAECPSDRDLPACVTQGSRRRPPPR